VPEISDVAELQTRWLMSLHNEILQFFSYEHLKDELQAVSKQFHDLAHKLYHELPPNPERSVALRKLLEAKDAAVRAKIAKP
jgi:hypothetical protein